MREGLVCSSYTPRRKSEHWSRAQDTYSFGKPTIFPYFASDTIIFTMPASSGRPSTNVDELARCTWHQQSAGFGMANGSLLTWVLCRKRLGWWALPRQEKVREQWNGRMLHHVTSEKILPASLSSGGRLAGQKGRKGQGVSRDAIARDCCRAWDGRGRGHHRPLVPEGGGVCLRAAGTHAAWHNPSCDEGAGALLGRVCRVGYDSALSTVPSRAQLPKSLESKAWEDKPQAGSGSNSPVSRA